HDKRAPQKGCKSSISRVVRIDDLAGQRSWQDLRSVEVNVSPAENRNCGYPCNGGRREHSRNRLPIAFHYEIQEKRTTVELKSERYTAKKAARCRLAPVQAVKRQR